MKEEYVEEGNEGDQRGGWGQWRRVCRRLE